MALAAARSQWDQTSLIWALLANTNRDPKERREPFMPWEIHPYRSKEDYDVEENDGPDLALFERLTAQVPATKLDYGKLQGN